MLLTAVVPLAVVASAQATFAPGPVIWSDGSATGEPGEITFRFTESRLPPDTEVHYRLSVASVHAPYVTPWKLRSDIVWEGTEYRDYGRRTLWSDPLTGSWYARGPNCCAGPTWDYTATSDATGTVHGETSYRWQADPGDGWMLSHYSLSGAVVADLDNGVHRHFHSYRIRCEHFGRDHMIGIRSGDEPPENPSPRPLCQVESPAGWNPYIW